MKKYKKISTVKVILEKQATFNTFEIDNKSDLRNFYDKTIRNFQTIIAGKSMSKMSQNMLSMKKYQLINHMNFYIFLVKKQPITVLSNLSLFATNFTNT